MATTNIQDLFKTYVGNSKDNNPHDEGQRKFEKKHITDKKVLFDPKLGAKNDQFQADNIKVINREKVAHGPNSYRQTGDSMGYNQGDNEQKVYSEESEDLAEATVQKDGYYITNHHSELTHPADKPYTDSKSAIRAAIKHEDKSGYVHRVTHVKGGKINKQWEGGEDYSKPDNWGYVPHTEFKGETFWHKPASVKLEEKHLTPAEMKKREEIAKGIEKGNPGMPMGKKMAIATSQAKKIAEAAHDASCTCSSCMTKQGKKMTKEDVINAAIARFMPEDYVLPTLEEKFTRAVDGLNERFALALVGLYESLNTDNKEEMVALMSTKEGMNKLIDFAINNGGE